MRAIVQTSNPSKLEYVRHVKGRFGGGPVRDGHGEAQEEVVVVRRLQLEELERRALPPGVRLRAGIRDD